MLGNTFMNVKNRSSTITAALDIPAGGANGALLSQGGRFGGWSLYMKDGKPAYTYDFLGLARYTIASPQALSPGPATVTLDFAYDGGGVGKGGKATLSVNGTSVAEGRVEKTQPNIFSADETADVGIDNQTPVAEASASARRLDSPVRSTRLPPRCGTRRRANPGTRHWAVVVSSGPTGAAIITGTEFTVESAPCRLTYPARAARVRPTRGSYLDRMWRGTARHPTADCCSYRGGLRCPRSDRPNRPGGSPRRCAPPSGCFVHWF